MKKKWICWIAGTAICLAGLCTWGYYSVKDYLKDKFAPNTWINGVYYTGRTPKSANNDLVRAMEVPTVTVIDNQGKQYEYDLEKADFKFDFSQSLYSCQKNQENIGMFDLARHENVIDPGEPIATYDEETVKNWWEQLPIVKAENKKPELHLLLKRDGYALESTMENHLAPQKGYEALVKAIVEKKTEVFLENENCYFDYEFNDDQMAIYQTWQELKAMEQCGLTYDMGAEKIVFDEALMCKFIAKDYNGKPLKDENGSYYYDLDVADRYMDELCESYHTYGVERPFKTSRESGDVVMIKPGNFGTEIDKKAEKAFLREILTNEELRLAKTVHVPTYLHETLVHGLDDVGGTYIEVDKLEQKIYYYQDYQLMVTSGIVTGNLRTRHDTYEGAFYIMGKYKNRILRGPGYASFVRRWMPIYRAIGLHDANWRKESEFGGETYKRNGSHGCVNMPDETTDVIFDNAIEGTPVFIFQ